MLACLATGPASTDSLPNMTLDDQLAAMRPLTPAAIAKWAGYRTSDVFRPMRARGSTIPAKRLREIATRMRGHLAIIEALAQHQEEE